MDGEFYGKLIVGFDMTPFGIHPDIYEVMGYPEKILRGAEMTGDPIFVPIQGDRNMVFMTPALYAVLTDQKPGSKGE